jgi:hypothetical protein
MAIRILEIHSVGIWRKRQDGVRHRQCRGEGRGRRGLRNLMLLYSSLLDFIVVCREKSHTFDHPTFICCYTDHWTDSTSCYCGHGLMHLSILLRLSDSRVADNTRRSYRLRFHARYQRLKAIRRVCIFYLEDIHIQSTPVRAIDRERFEPGSIYHKLV